MKLGYKYFQKQFGGLVKGERPLQTNKDDPWKTPIPAHF